MMAKLSFLFLFCFGLSFAGRCPTNYCCEEESDAQILFDYYYSECVRVGGPRLEGGVARFNVSDEFLYCVSGSCNNCADISHNPIIDGCCNIRQVEPASNYLSNCVAVAQSGPGISFPQILSTDLLQFCSNVPAGEGSNLCKLEKSSSSGSDASSSSGGTQSICRPTLDELEPILAELIYDCEENRRGEENFDIEEFEEYGFCIKGGCKYGSDSSSSSGDDACVCSYNDQFFPPNSEGFCSHSEGIVHEIWNCRDDSSSSSGGSGESCEIGDYYWDSMSKYDVFKRTLYPLLPYMLKKDEMYVSGCGCSGRNLVYCQVRNFGYVDDFRPVSLSLCDYSSGYWCRGIDSGSGATCDFSGSSAYIYHTDNTVNDWLVEEIRGGSQLFPLGSQSSYFGVRHYTGTANEWLEIFLTHGFTLPSNVSAYDLEQAVLAALPDFPSLDKMHAYCRGEWVPHDEDCYGTMDEAVRAAADTAIACNLLGGVSSYAAELSGRGWCAVGECTFEDEKISSSSESSSSSEPPSSSSSSSVFDICLAYPLPSTPANPLNACFAVNGKCYKCNPSRGAECSYNWLWSSGFSEGNVGWWYMEIACDGSEPVEPVTPGGCKNNKRGENAVYTSDDCFSSGLDNMEPGKCYALNPERGTQYGWISNNAQDGYWWEEVSCDDEVEFCPRGLLWADGNNNILYKKATAEATESYYEFPWRTKNYLYDALGRKTNDDRKTRRFLFSKGVPLDNTPQEPLVLLRDSPVRDSYGNECGVFGRDYGFVRNGYLHGGKTCYKLGDIASKEEIEAALVEEALGRCGRNKVKTRLYGIIPAKVSLETNKIFYVEEGDIISGLYGVLGMNAVDKATEIKMCRHEAGHQRDNARLVQEKTVYISLDITACGCPEAWKKVTDFLNAEQEKIRKPYYDLIENATAEYHILYGNDGAPSDVQCPN